MKKLIGPLFLLQVMFTQCAQEPKPGSGEIEFISEELSSIISKDAKIETLTEGFQWSEGPVWDEKQQAVLFSDVPTNTIYKWTEAKGKEVYLKPSGYTGSVVHKGQMGSNGLAISADGKLYLCQHGDRRIAMMDAPLDAPKPNFITVAGTYNGKKFNSPNDIVVTDSGDVYFTDPPYGLEGGMDDPKKEISFQGVYKADKNGRVTLLIDSIERPNGIAITPDGKTLLVANSDEKKKVWYAYDFGPNDSLMNARVFFDASNVEGAGLCDGIKLDKAGNVYATGPGGVFILNKSGKLIGKIKINGVPTANCVLSTDEKTLYLTSHMYFLRVKLR